MTMPCSYRTVECSSCGSSVFAPIVAGRNAYRDQLGRTLCDACTARQPVAGRPAAVPVRAALSYRAGYLGTSRCQQDVSWLRKPRVLADLP